MIKEERNRKERRGMGKKEEGRERKKEGEKGERKNKETRKQIIRSRMKDKQCTKIIGLTMTSETVNQIANDLFDFCFMCAFEGERFQTERNRMAESC